MSHNALQKCLKGNLQKTMLCIAKVQKSAPPTMPSNSCSLRIIDLEMTNKGFIVYIIDRMTSVAVFL